MSVIFLDVALAGSKGQALLKDFPEGHEQIPFLGMGIHASGIRGHVQPGNSQNPTRVDDLRECVQDGIGHLLEFLPCFGGARLIAHWVDTFIHTLAMSLVPDLFDRITLVKIDRETSDFLGHRKTLRYAIYDVNFSRSTNDATERCHDAHRASTEYRHCIAGADFCQIGAVVSGAEDVRKK